MNIPPELNFVVHSWPSLTKPKGNHMRNITLSPQEAQLVASILTQAAGIQQDYREGAKVHIDSCWKLSEKDTPEGRWAFKILNKGKDRVRQSKAYEAKINNLIRKIRKGL